MDSRLRGNDIGGVTREPFEVALTKTLLSVKCMRLIWNFYD